MPHVKIVCYVIYISLSLPLSLILALEIMHSANCQRFRKWLTWHISSQYNWIHKTISKISKENKFKCLGSELSLFHERPLDSTLTQINCENYCKLEKYKNKYNFKKKKTNTQKSTPWTNIDNTKEITALWWKIEVDGDAKSCFDAIKEGCSTVAWPIQWFQSMICDVVDFSNFFVSCNFN